MSDLVTIDIKDHVADVRLNRPEKMNAVNPRDVEGDLRGRRLARGRARRPRGRPFGQRTRFCAGLDMESMQGMVKRDDDAPGSGETLKAVPETDPENTFQRAAIVWKRLPMPVIGAIHGVAFGAGAQIALGADIRIRRAGRAILDPGDQMGADPGRRHLPDPARDRLPRRGEGADLDGTDPRRAGGPELGLATHVSERPLEDALALAAEIATQVAGRDSPRQAPARGELARGRPHGLELEAHLQGQLVGSPNQIESVKANFEKRAPSYAPPTD